MNREEIAMKKIIAILACLALVCAAAVAEGFEVEGFFEGAESVSVASFEEAAEIYTGDLPALTVPEGFELQEVLVDEFGLTAYYESEDALFEMNVNEYGEVEGVSHYGLENGALVEAKGVMVDIYEEEGLVTSADVYTPLGAIYFYFEGMDLAAVQAVLAGLAL